MFENAEKFNISDRIGYLFSEFFGLIYPYVHNHFVSYSLILAVAVGIAWMSIKQFKKQRATGQKLIWTVLGLLSSAFAAWLVLFHFHTFMQADLYYTEEVQTTSHSNGH
ncbi:hypothetical protein EBR57_04510 [bacterium]|nr:hypothetical protein [bacterium]